jgi:hypothetical protein
MRSDDDGLALRSGRWVVRYLGEGEPPAADLALIRHTVVVLDTTSRMLLVEATPDQLAGLVRALPHWRTEKERSFTLVT